MRLMRLSLRFSLFALLLLFSFIIVTPLVASASERSESIQHIYDEAGLLSTSEIAYLEQMCIDYGNQAGLDIIILTHNKSDAVDGEIYLENFYDKMLYGDSVLLLIDMYNRDVVLEGYGLAETNINSNRGDIIIDDITPHLSGADYEKAFEIFIRRSAEFMENDVVTPASLLKNPWIQLIIAMMIGGIAVGIMAYNSGGKVTVGGNTYIDSNSSGLIGRRDDYIRTVVTRVRKPTQNSSGGGMSAGGHSHSTSRGKF